MDGPRIDADVFERESGVPSHLKELGASVRMRRLAVGDYSLPGGAIVERKSVGDLHATILKGRLWTQLGRLRRTSGTPFLLVEGPTLDAGPVRPRSVRGACIATARLGIVVLRSTDPVDSASWLLLVAQQLDRGGFFRNRPAYAQRPKSPPERAGEAMLAAVPGIGPLHARRLLDRFGSVAGMVDAGPEALSNVDGIGPKRGRALAGALGLPHSSS